MLQLSCTNPALTQDGGDEFGPDLDAWDIRKGIRTMLKTTTVTEHSLGTRT